jgi:hypothetical protein
MYFHEKPSDMANDKKQKHRQKINRPYCHPLLLIRIDYCPAEIPGRKKENTARKNRAGFERMDNHVEKDSCSSTSPGCSRSLRGLHPEHARPDLRNKKVHLHDYE